MTECSSTRKRVESYRVGDGPLVRLLFRVRSRRRCVASRERFKAKFDTQRQSWVLPDSPAGQRVPAEPRHGSSVGRAGRLGDRSRRQGPKVLGRALHLGRAAVPNECTIELKSKINKVLEQRSTEQDICENRCATPGLSSLVYPYCRYPLDTLEKQCSIPLVSSCAPWITWRVGVVAECPSARVSVTSVTPREE